jgi:hypothetical protein
VTENRYQKTAKSTIYLLLEAILVVFLFFAFIWPGIKFWNLQKDLATPGGLSFMIPASSSPKMIELPMTVGLRLPPVAEIAADDFHFEFLENKGKINPLSRKDFLAKVPDYQTWLKKIEPVIDAEIAKLTLPVDFSKVKFTIAKTEIDTIQISTIVRSWNFLAVCIADRRSVVETARLLIGGMLLGLSLQNETLCHAGGAIYYISTLVCIGNSARTFMHLLPDMVLSAAEAKYVSGLIEKIEESIAPVDYFIKKELADVYLFRDVLRLQPVPPRLFTKIRWPGRVYYEIVCNSSFLEEFAKEQYDPFYKYASEPWDPDSPAREAYNEKKKEARRILAMPQWMSYLRYTYQPEEYVKTYWISSHNNYESLKSQFFTMRQHLRMLRWSLALFAFFNEKHAWPKSEAELRLWWGKNLPEDLFFNGPVLFTPGAPPDIRSVGDFQKPFDEDDIPVFIPSGMH